MKLVFLLLLVFSPYAWSLDILFGPEFTFGKIDNTPADPRMMIARMDSHLIDGQSPGAKFHRSPKRDGRTVRYESPNGWNATVGRDSGVVEVQMKPMTVEMFAKFQRDIQDAIFASAANTDQWPLLWRGGGHINLSFKTFENDPILFRNFIVDCYNHNELFMGVLGYDTHNALSWNMHPERRAALEKVIESFDRGNYEFHLTRFAEDLSHALNQTGIAPEMLWENEIRVPREFAINFGWVSGGRLEIRAVRPQASVDMWVRQIRLIRNRLKYLQKLKHPLAIEQRVSVQPIDPQKHVENPPVDPQAALRSFYIYVTESGEKWRDHRDYLWPQWGWSGEIKKFERSHWFRQQQSLRKCEKRLVRVI